MTENPVHFGTDGWRAIIADTFTFENVRACAQAVAAHFSETYGLEKPVVVGYDTRFLSDQFAREVARVLAGDRFQGPPAARPRPPSAGASSKWAPPAAWWSRAATTRTTGTASR
ncbi:MAG TPA: hypothetical protein PKA49_09020 [Tepidiformaceae bacterium]|nr:hypothetical protein [Tepidiformaceae bacterium]